MVIWIGGYGLGLVVIGLAWGLQAWIGGYMEVFSWGRPGGQELGPRGTLGSPGALGPYRSYVATLCG